MDKIFLIEKTEDTEELTKELSKIIKQVKKEEDKNNLILLMRRILTQKINEKEIEKIINEIKKEGRKMFAVEEMIIEENKRIRAEGRREGRTEGILDASEKIAKELLKMNLNIEVIKKATGLSIEKINKLKLA